MIHGILPDSVFNTGAQGKGAFQNLHVDWLVQMLIAESMISKCWNIGNVDE